MKRNRQILVWALGLGLAASTAAFATGHDVALGGDGTVYQVRTGLYGTLFPNGKETGKTNPVVALDVTRPGASAQRILVPGSGGSEPESVPSVVYEDDSQTVFLLWASEFNVHPVLQLTGYDGSRWSKTIMITGNPFAPKTSPQFIVTRDVYPSADGETVAHRTILHLIWQELGAGDQLGTYYAPVIINDGVYLGWNPIYDLDDFLPAPARLAAPAALQPSVAAAPLIQPGRDERTVVIAYGSPSRGQMATVEVDVLPEELLQLADKARSHIIDIGRSLYPGDLATLAEKARSHIIDIGVAFRPDIAQSIGDQVKAQILADGSGSLNGLAEKARSHIIDIGVQLSGRGLRGPDGNDAFAKIVQVDDTPDPAAPADSAASPYHLLQIRSASTWQAPAATLGAVRLFTSPSGGDMIVSWTQADRVIYRSSQGNGGWSDPRTLMLSDSLNADKAYDILDQRVRRH